MTALHRVFLSLGANLGERREQIEAALQQLREWPGFQLEKQSAYYETAPQDVPDQPWFLNLVVSGRTELRPELLLHHFQIIERSLGRQRSGPDEGKRGPRSIDIDILLYDDLVLHSPTLTIPHERMHARRFVLQPLCEIFPEGIHPESGRSFASLLTGLSFQEAKRLNEIQARD